MQAKPTGLQPVPINHSGKLPRMFSIALALSFCARERKRYYDAGGQPVNQKAIIHGAGRIYISLSWGFVALGKWSSEYDVKTAGN